MEEKERTFHRHDDSTLTDFTDDAIDGKLQRFMGDGAAYNYRAMKQAIEDAGLTDDQVSNERTGMVMGSGGTSTRNLLWSTDTLREKSAKRVGRSWCPG